ncbi:LysM peptidoglycan-binding domain-containing M23 family metallopeptidase [Streptomyces sp. LP11]|uniref:LysM peptidoglycan-binding domain-containing M23 family metallopeptidase n=1 Tax=Streptomyces pyxinicus TaxID=2970331 RepID=A0ABT2AU94_9ACTN|nr:LysM peptidoglycan-binding domain-containing M23 family metallopeptidase [Streptomyces sp. LP11]MCS0599827.1 LysM peptidoglycan-binding domain-containing M23 family metallopeptidase [Streptomyces sp. LP11]
MPAKGKHRRPKAPRLSRSLAVAGTGGAALALPLVGAAGAHAATPAQSVSGKAVQSLPVAGKKAASQASPTVRGYTVKSGDCLSVIAETQHVAGGWQRLYEDNRGAVGADPSLIHPGLKLTLGKEATQAGTGTGTAAPRQSSAEPQAAPSAPAKAAPTAQQADSADAPAPAADYTLPVTGATIGTGYHVAGSMWSSGYHTGVDFVVPTGTSLKAVGAGTVISAGWGGAYGNQVVVKLADGHYAQYAHLSQLSVSAGQSVTPGQQIGLSGATGNVTGPHLHFEIRTTPDYGSDIDPVGYLRQHGVTVG